MGSNITEKQIVDFLRQKRANLLEELEKTELALKALGEDPHPTAPESKESTQPLQGIAEYDANLKLDQKIAFALYHLKVATKSDIVNFLATTDPELDVQKLENNLAVRLSHLIKENLIEGNKVGRTYNYHLIVR